MNGRERFMTALRGETPDRVPLFEYYWALPFIRQVLGTLTSPHHNADDQVRMSRAMGIDMVYTAPYGFTSFTSVQLHGDVYTDEWGMKWGSNQDSWPGSWPLDHAVNNYHDWKNITLPDPDLPQRMQQPKRTKALANGDLAVLGGIRGPFSATSILTGLVNLCTWLFEHPEFVHDMMHRMCDWNTKIGVHLIESGVDAVIIHDDWGMNQATFIRPAQWREFVRPYIAGQIRILADTGTPVILHSDGNLNQLMDEIARLPIAALNPLQRSARMNLAEIKQTYGDRLCLIGNIDTTSTLSHGTPADVEQQVLECLRDAAPGGGYIMAADHSFHSAIPEDNIRCVIRTCQKYGTYPLQQDKINTRLEELQNNQ